MKARTKLIWKDRIRIMWVGVVILVFILVLENTAIFLIGDNNQEKCYCLEYYYKNEKPGQRTLFYTCNTRVRLDHSVFEVTSIQVNCQDKEEQNCGLANGTFYLQ